MIEISMDVGKIPSVFTVLAAQKMFDKLAKVAAETYVDETLGWIDAGKAFTNRDGILQQSIGWSFSGNATSEVFANAEYAGWVEYGTDPHVIEPKTGGKGSKIPTAGAGFFFSGKVNHPGSKPYPFFFADRDKRINQMHAEMISVLAAHVDNARG